MKYLISGPRDIFICEACVADCVGVLESQGSHDPIESTRHPESALAHELRSQEL